MKKVFNDFFIHAHLLEIKELYTQKKIYFLSVQMIVVMTIRIRQLHTLLDQSIHLGCIVLSIKEMIELSFLIYKLFYLFCGTIKVVIL